MLLVVPLGCILQWGALHPLVGCNVFYDVCMKGLFVGAALSWVGLVTPMFGVCIARVPVFKGLSALMVTLPKWYACTCVYFHLSCVMHSLQQGPKFTMLCCCYGMCYQEHIKHVPALAF